MAGQGIICDTNILIELFDRDKERHERTASAIRKIGEDNLMASSATLMELMKGYRDKEHRQQVMKNIRGISFFPLTPEITDRTVKLLDTYRLEYGLDILDALIAATSIELKMKLFTYNVKDFRFIDGLQLYVP